jgi:signal transduction histidine kinase/DNA-binding response OmpR family regulator
MESKSLPKILYVDDTPEARLLVLRLLSHKYQVFEASDALSGIELALQTQPDLVLLDINLPHLNGREVAARLTSLLPNTPLVAFSAETSASARGQALAAGCIGYLTKPLDVDTFEAQVTEFLHGKREVAADAAQHRQAFEAQVVARLEEKVRELTKTAEHNAYLNAQNEKLGVALRRRQRLLEAAARAGQIVTSVLNLDELLPLTVNVICEEYGFLYAGVFLLDPAGEWAVLRAGRGEAGQAMVAEGHRLRVGAGNLVGAAIQQQKARLAPDVRREPSYTPHPRLPHICSELALPLVVNDVAVGALSIQSDQVNAFGDDAITALQTLANQVAIAINNARLLLDLNEANRELLRTKTFEAVATATGEALHWVGNKAAPIPGSASRVRDDLALWLAIFQALLTEPADRRARHPLWPLAERAFQTAAEQGLRLPEAADLEPEGVRRRFGDGVESMVEDLAIIEQSAATILSIKEDLIGPARLHQVTAVDLAGLLREVVFQMGLPEGVIQLEFSPDLPPVRADRRQLAQVYNNLIKNAWEALTSAAAPQPRIRVSAERAGDGRQVVTRVSDNGPGIPPEIIDKIWVSFFTTKGHRGGTGLGLSACQSIVSQAEGKITVASQVGTGTTFTVWLPAAAERTDLTLR